MHLDRDNDLACGDPFYPGKLAKRGSHHNIADTKPVDSVEIVPFGAIERIRNSLVESEKP